MNVILNNFYNNSVCLLKESLLSTLKDKQKMIVFIASIAFGCLAACFALKRYFKASLMDDDQHIYSQYNKIFASEDIFEEECEDNGLIEPSWSEVSKVLRAKGLPKNLFDQSLYSPLQAAVLLQDLKLCKKMVEAGFSINSPGKTFKQSALAIALGQTSEEIRNDLYKKCIDARCFEGVPSISHSQEIALYLIENGADLTYQTDKGYTYLHDAAALGYDKVCKILLDKGLDVNKIVHGSYSSEKEITPLLRAVQFKQIAVIKLLLEYGAKYQSPPIDFHTYRCNPFCCALEEGNEGIIQVFLDHGAQLDQEIDWIGDKTALLFAITKHINDKSVVNERLFELAVKAGINLEHKFGIDQRTYLHLAALSGNKSLCEFLIKSGANIHALDATNQNVLHLAARNKNAEELIPFFLQKGVDARALDMEGQTPLMSAQLPQSIPNTLKVLPNLKEADKGLSSLMQSLRFLGLSYSLKGAAFEGCAADSFLYDKVASSLEDYLKNQQNLPLFFYTLPKIIQNSKRLSSEDILLQLKQDGIISFANYWNRHATIIILTENFVIKGNRGNECGKESGMTLYKIKNPSNLSKAVETLIFNRDSLDKHGIWISEEKTKKHIEFFKKGINDLLDLERLSYLPRKKQTAGNCGLMAARMAVEGCLIAYYLQEDLKENSSRKVEDILKLTNPFMSSWKEYDYTCSLEILEQIEDEPVVKDFIDIEKVYDELFTLNLHRRKALARLCQLRPRLLKWITHPDPELISYGYQHRSAKIIKWFLDQDVDPDMSAFLTCESSKINALHYDYFVKKGIKANVPDSLGNTPLHVFIMKSRSLPEQTLPVTLQLISEWKKECESSNNLQLLGDALNAADENGLTPLQHLIKDNDDLSSFDELINLMKECGARE